jgi:O-antigen ligase
MLLLPLLYFATDGQLLVVQGHESKMVSLSAAQIVVGLGFWSIAVFLMAPSYKQILRTGLRSKALTIFLAYAFFSAFWSPDITNSLRKVLLLALLILFGYFLADRYQPEELMRLIFAVGCLTVLGSYLFVILVPGRGIMPGGEWCGLLGHKNSFGIYLVFYLMPFFFMSRKMTLVRLISVGWILLGLIGVYMSQSRSAWITCGFLAGYVCLSRVVSRFKSIDTIAIISVALGLIGTFTFFAYENLSLFTDLIGKSDTFTGRTKVWRSAIWAIGRHLFFGYGYAGFWNGLTPESSSVNTQLSLSNSTVYVHAHDGFLNLALQLGIVGMALLAIVLIGAFRDAIRSIVVYRSKAALWYVGILLGILEACVDESMLMNYFSLASVLLVLACVGLGKTARGQSLQ